MGGTAWHSPAAFQGLRPAPGHRSLKARPGPGPCSWRSTRRSTLWPSLRSRACACWTSQIVRRQVSPRPRLPITWSLRCAALCDLWRLRLPGRPLACSPSCCTPSVACLRAAPGATQALACPCPAVLSGPLELTWPNGAKRSTYHDVKWNESLNVLLAAGKDKLVDMYTLA